MNMQEITRSINGYHNQIQANRNTANINKFINYSNKKVNKREINSKKANSNKSKSIDLSSSSNVSNTDRKKRINTEQDNINKNKLNCNTKEKNGNVIEEEEDIEEEIRELEIDEENILKLIEDIQNFGKNLK